MGITLTTTWTTTPPRFFGQEMDDYYARYGGWPYAVFNLAAANGFGYGGIEPLSYFPFQRTFGPFIDPMVAPLRWRRESGFTGYVLRRTGRYSQLSHPAGDPDY